MRAASAARTPLEVPQSQQRWLVGCESSGAVRRALRARGLDAYSCDLLPAEDDSPYHLQCDVRDVLNDAWDGGIFHPPCTTIANSSNKHLYLGMKKVNGPNPKRWAELDEGCALFRACLNAPIDRIAVENPIPHGHGVERIGRTYDQLIQPWMFGHPETKATCFWLKNLPPLQPTNDVREEMRRLSKKERSRVHYASPGPDRWKERSRTLPGIAAAMAQQWAGA